MTENRQARTLQNSENFVLSQNGVWKYFLAKLFVRLIKGNISTTFETLFGKLNFWLKISRRAQNGVRKYFFGKIICSTDQKKHFFNIWGSFWKIEFLRENQQARTLQNSENFVLSLNGVRKYIFGKIICSIHQKKHFYNIWDTFWKIEFLTENRQARTLQNSENYVLYQNGVRKYFMAKLFVPLIKRNISTTFETLFGKLNFWLKISRRAQNGVRKYFFGKIICSTDQKKHFFNIWGSFWKIEFLRENQQARTLQNSENFVLSLNGVRKYIFGKIICSIHQKKHFYNIWDTFWKIKFLTENRQARTLQNSENFVLSQNGVRKYFMAKLFVPLIKRNISQHLRQFLENWNFDVKSTGADLTK